MHHGSLGMQSLPVPVGSNQQQQDLAPQHSVVMQPNLRRNPQFPQAVAQQNQQMPPPSILPQQQQQSNLFEGKGLQLEPTEAATEVNVNKSISPEAFKAAVDDMRSVLSMMDGMAALAPGYGSRAAVGKDLAATKKRHLECTMDLESAGTSSNKRPKTDDSHS